MCTRSTAIQGVELSVPHPELEHNYGDSQRTLSMGFYFLNLLAFLAHKASEFGEGALSTMPSG